MQDFVARIGSRGSWLQSLLFSQYSAGTETTPRASSKNGFSVRLAGLVSSRVIRRNCRLPPLPFPPPSYRFFISLALTRPAAFVKFIKTAGKTRLVRSLAGSVEVCFSVEIAMPRLLFGLFTFSDLRLPSHGLNYCCIWNHGAVQWPDLPCVEARLLVLGGARFLS